MKIWKRAASVGLSLALCAGMVAPAFAATFTDLQNVINTGVAYESEKGGIAVSDESGTRTVTLNEDVEYDADKDGTKTGSIDVGSNLILDLNSHKIDGNDSNPKVHNSGQEIITMLGGSNVTIQNGTITGSKGTGIAASSITGKLKLENVDVVDNAGRGISVTGKEGSTVELTGGSAKNNGENGVYLGGSAEFSVENATISDNGNVGIDVRSGAHGTITDTAISDNEARGVFVGTGSKADLDGVTIENNGGGVFATGQLSVSNSTIVNNHAPETDDEIDPAYDYMQSKDGGGIYHTSGNDKKGTLTLGEGNEIHSNTSQAGASDIYAAAGATITGLDNATKAPSNKQFDGWYEGDDKYETNGVTAEAVNLVAGLSDAPSVPGIGDGDVGDTALETEIDDVEVPLAGLFTRADAIGYLWQQAGEPEAELSDFLDVDADHQWAVAIGWAQDMGIALPDLEGNFRPDDLVERFVEDEELKPEGELQEFLNRYAEYAGIELDEDELFYVLGGQADDIVMGEDAQIIFDDFFARLEAALAQAA